MDEKNKKVSNKFNFVDSVDTDDTENINNNSNIKKVSIDKFIFIDDNEDTNTIDYENKKIEEEKTNKETIVQEELPNNKSTKEEQESNEKVHEDKKETIEEHKNIVENKQKYDDNNEEESIKRKPYFSFEARVATLAISVIILLAVSIFIYVKTFSLNQNRKVSYNEISDVSYKVCLNKNDFYTAECLNENMEYIASIIDKINVNFKYNVDFSTKIDYDIDYHVIATTKIYDKNDSNKILYEDEEMLVEKTSLKNTSESINILTDIKVDYKKYNDYVLKYIKNYSVDARATLDIKLFSDEPDESREVASITMPLGQQTFGIVKNEIINTNKTVIIKNDIWTAENALYIIIATLVLLITLLLLFKLTNLILKVINNKNKFESAVLDILREYDRLIVVARGGYESNVEKRIIKVHNFEELLNARNLLNKPIVYSKVNNVKCEFIVEDDSLLYKYVMKEADFS